MPDESLLAAARAAAQRWRAARQATEEAKAAYQQVVRRLHLAGASYREIADALELSHQRVHQLVEAAGGTADWRPKLPPGTPACGFCATPKQECGRLVAGPGVFICDYCVGLAARVLAEGPVQTARVSLDLAGGRFECTFCAKPASEAGRLVAGPGVRICGGCACFAAEVVAATAGS
ncbi:hypothetical protein JOF53_003474 [Crossiella equi]|uniref:ClpX-type ZB domain-containing protein n=1 Tax=Crossiella equi TaxID=130796 RepID=A0ABS5AEC4_9PSEU|nr:ClpX C4-type zinc finger protein [Crossiella equi]MBP2474602.1 hypothetical protein [Crossiella equi]